MPSVYGVRVRMCACMYEWTYETSNHDKNSTPRENNTDAKHWCTITRGYQSRTPHQRQNDPSQTTAVHGNWYWYWYAGDGDVPVVGGAGSAVRAPAPAPAPSLRSSSSLSEAYSLSELSSTATPQQNTTGVSHPLDSKHGRIYLIAPGRTITGVLDNRANKKSRKAHNYNIQTRNLTTTSDCSHKTTTTPTNNS